MSDPTIEPIYETDREVIEYIERHPDSTLRMIEVGLDRPCRDAVRRLVRAGFVKQKEDSVDHDWVYRSRRAAPDARREGGEE